MRFNWVKYYALLFVSAFSATPANASTTAVYQIDASPGSFLQATLTQDIYRFSADPQLRDLVILDEQDNRLPFRIISVEPQQVNAGAQTGAKTSLPFFPVAVGAAPETWLSGKTHIRIDQQAISIDIDNDAITKSENREPDIDFYLLDLDDLDSHIDSLALEWQTEQPNPYLEVEVSGTRDLKNWTRLAQDTLVHLQKDNQTLTRNEIQLNLPRKQYVYLRIKFLRGAGNLTLTRVFAQTQTQKINKVTTETWTVEGTPAQDSRSALPANRTAKAPAVAAWEYRREERAPIEKLHLDLGEITYGDDLAVFSRAAQKQSWRLIHRGIWFNARVGSDWQRSDAIIVSANTDPYWRIELNQELAERGRPVLMFEHPPQRLQFIANNAAPYRIAIDHKAADSYAYQKIFAQLTKNKKPEWVDVSFSELNPDISKFEVVAAIDWRTGLFWGILLIAVAVLIAFAVRLYRQMN